MKMYWKSRKSVCRNAINFHKRVEEDITWRETRFSPGAIRSNAKFVS